ncbi:hypothetical protein [Streptomyces sp. NPDC059003]|uniref:hypothetical protein n=1 Tax=Streptomyces sp. NPDC059003 TaxID=3346691 RepID=UPI0036C9BADC
MDSATLASQARLRGDAWLFKHDWGFDTKPSAGDFDAYMRSLLVCAKGDGAVSAEERNWVLGYCAALGGDPELIQRLETYPADDELTELVLREPVVDASRRALVFDAIRACDADGELASGELESIREMAGLLGVADSVDRLHELYRQEEKARADRLAVIFPDGAPL